MKALNHSIWKYSALILLLGGDCSPDMTPTIIPVPTLSAVSPALGPTTGGIELTLDGRDFVDGAVVTVDGIPATRVSVTSPTHITAMLPARTGPWGAVPVVVTNPDGQKVTRGDLFEYYSGQLGFVPSVFASDEGPFSVVVADFNGDKHSDLAIANLVDGTISAFFGNGIGGFSALKSFPFGRDTFALVTADFDGDHNLDLAAINNEDNNIGITLGDGKGGFSTPQFTAVGMFPIDIAVGDFDSDQKPDLVVANGGSNDLSILLNRGSGRVSTPVSVAAGKRPSAVAVGDFNGDQRADLAVANAFLYSISIYFGNGMGGFSPGEDFSIGYHQPRSMLSTDIDGDQLLDLVITNSEDNIIILFGSGVGRFGTIKSFTTKGYSTMVAAGDFNGDRKTDFVVTNQTDKLSILLGDGIGNFTSFTDITSGINTSYAVAVGDFNGDHMPDIISTAPTNGNSLVSILLNQSK